MLADLREAGAVLRADIVRRLIMGWWPRSVRARFIRSYLRGAMDPWAVAYRVTRALRTAVLAVAH